MDSNPVYQSVLNLLQTLATEQPERVLYRFVKENGRMLLTLNSRETLLRAQQIAHGLLVRHHLKVGDRVLLVYPPGLEFVEAFLGCLYAVIIPVPVCPPMPIKPEAGLSGYTAMALDCKAVAQLTNQLYSTSRAFGRIRQALTFGKKWPKLPWIITDNLTTETQLEPISVNAKDLAFLQYTSGSTSAPKGVCISFGNIWDQWLSNRIELDMGPEGKSLVWMPHYHDFTLINGILNAAAGNNQLILFSAMDFLHRPALWGELLHRFKATHTAAPDFGYKLFTQRTTPEERAVWDLSSLRIIMSAAEPIHAETVDAFLEAFSVSKMNPAAFCPAYGLAEHTVSVSVKGQQRFKVERDALEKNLILQESVDNTVYIELFGCGRPSRGVALEIVDPKSHKPLPEGHIGEIWVDSPSKAEGYFNQPEETKLKFEAELNQRKWLRTGDLGTLYHGEVVVVGRLDDMIVLSGRNVFPQDVETIISSCDNRIRSGRVIAFGTHEQNNEELVAVFELRNNAPEQKEFSSVCQIIRASLQQELGLSKITLVIAQRGKIPKTSSGKLQRKKCATAWRSNNLPYILVCKNFY